jgi:Mlc titration factor MtfA (ptsG expression regulator)
LIFGTRRRDRRAREAEGFRPEWRDVLARRLHHWRLLTPDERERLEDIAMTLIADKRWEAAHGFELTDEMVVTIAGRAALLVLKLPDDSYRQVGSIVVHPTTLVMHGEHSTVEGIVSDDPTPILGEAHWDGPILLAWDSVLADSRHPVDGHDVVLHEFAHKLDMLDGTVDGTPPMADRGQLDRWVRVCTEIYEAVVIGAGGEVLDPYAGVNPGEFFAVATETFFDDPLSLRDEHPDLYAVLAEYYRQDPAARLE